MRIKHFLLYLILITGFLVLSVCILFEEYIINPQSMLEELILPIKFLVYIVVAAFVYLLLIDLINRFVSLRHQGNLRLLEDDV